VDRTTTTMSPGETTKTMLDYPPLSVHLVDRTASAARDHLLCVPNACRGHIVTEM